MRLISHMSRRVSATVQPSDASARRPRSDIRRLIVWGGVLLIANIGVIGIWASTVPLRSAVIAPGVIKVMSKRKAVQHFEGGIVQSIFVREGDAVQSGQLLARLDTAQIEAGLGVLDTKLFANLAMEARLLAEQTHATKIAFPEELLNAMRQEAKLAMQTQEAEFAARAASLQGESKLLDQQISQLQHTIRGLESSSRGLKQQLASLQEEIKDGDYLMARGLARKPKVLALRRAEAEVEAQMARNAATNAESHGKIAELEDRRRQLTYNRSQDIAKQLHKTSEEIADVRHRIAGLRDRLTRSDLRATESGVVVGLSTRHLNAVLGPRETLLEIVPTNDRLIIEAALRPSDRNEVYTGQSARIRILAFNIRRTPVFTGVVTTVSADALSDVRTGISSYISEIELRPTEDVKFYLSSLQPGMPVEVFIETGERTFAEYLFQPVMLRVNRAFRES